jgi:hypothetical protein
MKNPVRYGEAEYELNGRGGWRRDVTHVTLSPESRFRSETIRQLMIKTGIEDVDEEKPKEDKEGDATASAGAGDLSAAGQNQGEKKASLKT